MYYDFDYYSGRDLRYPQKPTKPVLAKNATAAQVRVYAIQLETHEAGQAAYQADREHYTRQINSRLWELKTRLRDEYNITEAQMHLLWARAYEDGHSEGLHRVVAVFGELYELASQFAALKK